MSVERTAWWTWCCVVISAIALYAIGAGPSGTTAHAIGIDDNCPAPDDGKNVIISDAPVIVGTPASDHICGGNGPNIIIGGLLDDDIYGGSGADVLIGGHGTDIMDGGSGSDWLRGGDNTDTYVGGFNGAGTDTASFADITPPNNDAALKINLLQGTAKVGGYTEQMEQIDNVIGSAFDDEITAAANPANVLVGGLGDDTLEGVNGHDTQGNVIGDDTLYGEQGANTCTKDGGTVNCDSNDGVHRPTGAFVHVDDRARDTGLVVMGAEGASDDSLVVTRPPGQLHIASGGPLSPLGGCLPAGPNAATCTPVVAADAAAYIVVWGGDGNDSLSTTVNLGAPRVTFDINGGTGNDVLTGGSDGENLFTGEGGADILTGNGGNDALIGEGDPVASGGDWLNAGPDDDQIVTDNACAGHTLQGGTGRDIIGFARQSGVGNIWAGVHAHLGEGTINQQAWAIDATDNEIPDCARSTIVGGDAETLEGTQQPDVLSGNNLDNTIWGRDGNDTLFGNGGSDRLYGHKGDDWLWGGPSPDWFYGGAGTDRLRAQNNDVDNEFSCGPDSDPPVQRDLGNPQDPVPNNDCEDPVHTNTYLTLDGWLNGQPGYVSVSGNVQEDDGTPIPGDVNVNFQKFVNGNWVTESTAHPTLSNGHYEVNNWGVGVGQWRVRAVFPSGQGYYTTSESGYKDFEVKQGYQIVARHSGKCLDVSERKTDNGQPVHQWDCQDPNTHQNQVFSLVPQSTGGLEIVARHSGRCVDVTDVSYAAGTGLQQWDCYGPNQSNQIWWRDPISPGSQYFTFKAKHSGQCMDVQGVGTHNGARVTQWPCIGGQLNQHWDLRPVNSGPILTQTYLTVNQVLHGQHGYISVSGNVQRSPVPGSGIPMSGQVHVNFQKLVNGNWVTESTAERTLSNGSYSVENWGVGVGEWRVRAVFPDGQGNFAQSESGYHGFTIRPGYHIVNRYSDKCMTLSGNNGANGTAIIQWTCSSNPTPGDGQVLHRVPMPGGGWQLKINSTGKCVDVSGASMANHAWLHQWDCLGAGQTNQIWQVIPIAGQSPWLAFRAVHSQKCADNTGPSTNNGVHMQQYDCNWTGGQQWDMRPVG